MENQVSSGESKKSFGPMIGVIIIILVLILGAFYVWGSKLSVSVDNSTNTNTAAVAPVSDGDDISSIESDLTAGGAPATDFSSIDASLK